MPQTHHTPEHPAPAHPLCDKKTLNELLQRHIGVRGLMAHPLASILGKGVLTQQELKHFCLIRYNAAPLFEQLVHRGYQLANETPGMERVAHALHENWCDERGMNPTTGKPTGDGSHSSWRRDCLTAIGVAVQEQSSFPLYAFTQADNAWVLTGMLLAAEYLIPLEYAKLLKSMRSAFPDIFTPADPSAPSTAEQEKASRYLVDHISHDAEHHLPDLLNAILHDLRSPADYASLTAGIERFAHERGALYSFIQTEMGYTAAA